MNCKQTFLSLVAACSCFGGTGLADEPRKSDRGPAIEKLFSRLDANGDGALEQSELPGEMWNRLGRADQNQDGKIDKSEAKAMSGSLEGRRGSKPGMPPSGGADKMAMAERAKKMFATLDKDGDGKVALIDLPAPFQERAGKLDKNQDGQIDQAEFAEIAKLMAAVGGGDGAMLDKAKQLFKQFDKDGDGKIALSELPAPIQDRLRKADSNGDEMIDQAELRAMAVEKMSADGKGKDRRSEESLAPQKAKRPKSAGAASE